jgi:hypothetical protein
MTANTNALKHSGSPAASSSPCRAHQRQDIVRIRVLARLSPGGSDGFERTFFIQHGTETTTTLRCF